MKPRPISFRLQASIIFGYALFSWLYICIASRWYLFDPPNRPPNQTLIPLLVLMALTILSWAPRMLDEATWTRVRESRDPGDDDTPDEDLAMRKTSLLVARALLAISLLVHICLLTWFTGGVLGNPFAQFITLCAVLAPFMSNSWQFGATVGVLSVSAVITETLLYANQHAYPMSWNQWWSVGTVAVATVVSIFVRYVDKLWPKLKNLGQAILRHVKYFSPATKAD